MDKLTEEMATKIWEILVSKAGAYDAKREREYFVSHQSKHEGNREWRFQGKLGFGGKFWVNSGRWYVNAYSEDMNDHRQKVIDETNAALEALRQHYLTISNQADTK